MKPIVLKILNLFMIGSVLLSVGCDREKNNNWLSLLALAGLTGSGNSGHGQEITFGYDVIAVYGSTIQSGSSSVKEEKGYSLNEMNKSDSLTVLSKSEPLIMREKINSYNVKSVDKSSGEIDGRATGESLKGTLTATNLDTSETTQFDWYGTLNTDTFQFTSTKTIVLNTDTYDFDLILSNSSGNHIYMGHADGVVLGDGVFDVDLGLAPMIGETDVTVTSSDLASLTLQYDQGEIMDAGLTAPSIGVIVDGGNEIEYVLNPQGKSDTTLDLTPGSYHLELKLYDTGIQKGRSLANQENVAVSANDNIVMDLVALHAQTTFSLLSSGGDATFHFTIPGDIVDEAGDLSNLEAIFTYSGSENGLHSNILTVNDVSGSYEATHTFDGFHYDTFTMELVFRDIADNEEIGSCIVSDVNLSESAQSMDCAVVLRRRALVTGNLLATLGVNVFTDEGEAVSGAEIRVNGDLVGLTGEDTMATAGFRKLYLVAGDYTISADSGNQHGESDVSLSALDVANVDVILGAIAPADWTDVVDGSSAFDIGQNMDSDSEGNLYITGYTQGSIHGLTHYGEYDYYIAKYDRNGDAVWINQGQTSGDEVANDVAVSESGSVYISGYTTGSIAGSVNHGNKDIFVIKYDNSGSRIWSKQYGSSGADTTYGIAVDGSENIYITGITNGSFNGSASQGYTDIFLMKLDSNGNEIWTVQYGSSTEDEVRSIDLDDSGNVYLAGYTMGNLDGNVIHGGYDIFVSRFSPDGNRMWTKLLGGIEGDFTRGITVDGTGNVYVSGYSSGNFYGSVNQGVSDALLMKLDSDGNRLWSDVRGTSEDDLGFDVRLDNRGNVYLTGYTMGNLDGNMNAGGADIFMIQYDVSGNHIQTQVSGTNAYELGYATTSTFDGVYVAGRKDVGITQQYAIWKFDP